MLELIGKHPLSTPSTHFIECIQLFKKTMNKNNIVVAEIGIGIGATTLEALKNLDTNDTYYIFDFKEKVDELYDDLSSKNYISKDRLANIIKCGNEHKSFDSYSWNLSSLYLQSQHSDNPILFDVVYLDGAHSWLHDAPTCCILKEMISLNGFLILDDMKWSFAKSPTMNPARYPAILNQYTEEQIHTPHINRIANIFMDTDKRFKKVRMEKLGEDRAIYQKIESISDYAIWKFITARLDIKNFGTDGNSVEVIETSDKNAKVQSPAWFKNAQGQGIVVHSYKGDMQLKIKCRGNGSLEIALRGVDSRDKNNKRFPVWIDYKKLKVNDQDIFASSHVVWHDKPFKHRLNVADGEVVTIDAEWKAVDNTNEFLP